ncbi:phage tail protein [Thalassospira sp.]|uniref:phage tail protein n=1 Tax=Thalassospira sp. TaxID=1912094 RepID=UPI0027349F8C|nr:tail fiber protein [Thalassospira sp.]MDP2698447.1 tail fiber protein [Thalassospira sp.]
MKTSLNHMGRAGILAVLATVATFGIHQPQATASDCADDGFASSVCWTGARYCPQNYLPADGRLLAVNGNEMLFSLLVTRFGGDGITNFALPDLRSRTIAGTGQGAGLPAVALAQSYGAERSTLTIANMAPHTHSWTLETAEVTGTLQGLATQGNSSSPENRLPGNLPTVGALIARSPSYGNAPDASLNSDVVSLTNTSTANRTESEGAPYPYDIPLRPAQQPLLACIMTQGLYPVRPN